MKLLEEVFTAVAGTTRHDGLDGDGGAHRHVLSPVQRGERVRRQGFDEAIFPAHHVPETIVCVEGLAGTEMRTAYSAIHALGGRRRLATRTGQSGQVAGGISAR